MMRLLWATLGSCALVLLLLPVGRSQDKDRERQEADRAQAAKEAAAREKAIRAQKTTPEQGERLPFRALQRFGTTKLRHGSRILSLAFSPDGKTLAAGGGNDPVRQWDLDTGKERTHFAEPWASAVAFSPQNTALVTAGAFKKIRFWKLADGKEVTAFEGHTAPVRALALSHDGSLLASGSQDGTILIWDVFFRLALDPLKGHTDEINALAFSSDGKKLASASSDRTIRIWDKKGELLHQIDGGCNVACLAFAADNKTLVSGGDDRLIRLWDVETGKVQATLEKHADSVVSVIISSDGKTLYSGSRDGALWVWDLAAKAPLRMIERDPGDSDALALSADGTLLATAGLNNTVRLFRADTGVELFAGKSRRPLTAVALTSQGELLAAAGPTKDTVLAYSPDGFTLATTNGVEPIMLRRADGREQKLTNVAAPIQCLRYSHDGELLAAGDRTGNVRVYKIADGKPAQELKYPGPVEALAFSHDGQTLAASGNGKVLVWNVASGKELQQLHSREGPPATQPHIACLAFAPDGATLAMGCYDAAIRFFDIASGKEIRRFDGHQSAVLSLDFSSDGRVLVTGSFDNTVRLWETASAQPMAVLHGHIGAVNAVRFGSRDRTVCSASADTTALSWDVTALGRELPTLNFGNETLQQAWTELAGEDARRGHHVLWQLIASAASSVPYVGSQLTYIEPKQIDLLFAQLDSEKYEVRNKASVELGRYGIWMKPRIEAGMKEPPSEEVRRRLEQLLNKLASPGTVSLKQERVRLERVMLLLEQIASPAAQEILQKLTRLAPAPDLQVQAQQSLRRIKDRR